MFTRTAGSLMLLLALVALGCGGGGTGVAIDPAPGTAAPDFLIQDVNPVSMTAGTDVSPRQHLGHVTAWYFGHST